MIGRIRDRTSFERLARGGSRVRSSALWCSWHPDPQLNRFQVAFAIGRASGNAVTRNRRRRQIRSILQQIDHHTPLPTGMMMIGARNELANMTFAQLSNDVHQLLGKAFLEPSA